MPTQAAVIGPVFVSIALTFALLFMMGQARFAALRSGAVKVRDVALGQSAWTERPAQMSRAFQNQFETPMLFYALVALVLVTKCESTAFVVMEWLFVACRLAHAFIHTTSNNVPRRFQAFMAGITVLMVMWSWFAVRLFV